MNNPFNLLSDYVIDNYHLRSDIRYVIEDVDSLSLLKPSRFDLTAKLAYIENYISIHKCAFYEKLYVEHIRAFSNGTFKEPGNENKNSKEKFIHVFNGLIQDINNKGVDSDISLIPVSNDYCLLDGAHRVSCAIYFRKKIRVIRFLDIPSPDYNYNHFKKLYLNSVYLDRMAIEYSKWKDNLYLACIWPLAFKKEDALLEIEQIFRENTTIVYKKEASLSYTGLRNLMLQLYREHSWIGNVKNHFAGLDSKVSACFSDNGRILFYLLECESLELIVSVKEQIRKVVGMGNHSIHITDTPSEMREGVSVVFNDNSLHHLNYGHPDKYVKSFNDILSFKQCLCDKGKDLERYIIVSSSVLAIYGLREALDVDYLTDEECDLQNDNYQSHNTELMLCQNRIEDILYDPNNYFCFFSLKFVSLNLLRDMKEKRGEYKDVLDVKMINLLLDETLAKRLSSIFVKLKTIFYTSYRKEKAFFISYLRSFLKKVGLFEYVKNIYYWRR